MSEAKKHIDPFEPVFLMVGCKGDLEESRQVSTEEAFSYAQSQEIHFLETSAKTGRNVEEAFQLVTQEIFTKVQAGEYRVDDEQWEGIKSGFANRSTQNSTSIIPEGLPEKSKCC
jgi:Ras-related protein Rab-39B